MFKHIVMWKLKDSAAGKSGIENADLIKSSLEKLPMLIPQILKYEIGINISDSAASYDVVLYSDFKSKEDFEIYRDHAEHKKVVDIIRERSAKTHVVDYTDPE